MRNAALSVKKGAYKHEETSSISNILLISGNCKTLHFWGRQGYFIRSITAKTTFYPDF